MRCGKNTKKRNIKKLKWGKQRNEEASKQIKKQEQMQKCYKCRQIGGTKTVGEKLNEVPLKNREKE